MKKLRWFFLSVFVLSSFFLAEIVLAEDFEVIETWQGYKITWNAPKGAKAKVEIPAFCLEFNKEIPKEGTSYELGKEKESPTLANIFKIYRILKENHSFRREFLLQDDIYSYLLKKAMFISMLMESEKVRQEIDKIPEVSNSYTLLIRSAEEFLSPKALRSAVQQAIWSEREGITVYDLQKKVSAEGRDFNPDIQTLANLTLLTIAPYTQIILEASGSEKQWIKSEDKLKLKEDADPLADELILHNDLEEALEVLKEESEVKDRFKKAYVWLEMGNSQKAWNYLDFQLEEEDIEWLTELKYFKLYLEDKKRFELFYQKAQESLKSKKLQEAKTYLMRALEILPYNSDARYLLGLINYNLGSKQEALKLWKEVMEETPLFNNLNFEARLARIAVLRETGKSQEMWSEYKEMEKRL